MMSEIESNAATGTTPLPHLPFYIPVFNHVIRAFLRIGVPMGPVTLLTVRGRKTGKPRRNPVGLFKHDGQHYLFSTFGDVNWVRNVRSAKQVTIRRRWHNVTVVPIELSLEDSARVLKETIAPAFEGLGGKMFREHFPLKRDSPFREFMEEAKRHPVFELREPSNQLA